MARREAGQAVSSMGETLCLHLLCAPVLQFSFPGPSVALKTPVKKYSLLLGNL